MLSLQGETVDVPMLSQAIAEQEGWLVPGSLVRRLRNPCALVYKAQEGARRGSGGYASFLTDEAGWMACQRDLGAKIALGWPLEKVLKRWSANPRVYPGLVLRRYRSLKGR